MAPYRNSRQLTLPSLRRLSKRLQAAQMTTENRDASPILTFDKDDVDTLDFVTSSANLRSIVFGIETRSKFDIKRTCFQWSLYRFKMLIAT